MEAERRGHAAGLNRTEEIARFGSLVPEVVISITSTPDQANFKLLDVISGNAIYQ